METLDKSESNASVKTGVVIGIFSFVEFFPKMYLLDKIWYDQYHHENKKMEEKSQKKKRQSLQK